jgi:hypothetical protein
VGSSVHQNKPWSDKCAGCAPQDLSLPETNMTYFFEESVRRVPDVGAPCRFDETISYSEVNDFAERFATLSAPRGVEKGGKVTCFAQANPQFLIARGLRILDRAAQDHGGAAPPRTSHSRTSGLFPAICASSTARGCPPGGRSQ